MQKMLTSLMAKVGSVVEKVASAVSKPKPAAKPKKTGVTDAEGQDFGFIQWNERQLHSLLAGAERKEIVPLFPALNGKKCLHLSPGGENYIEILAKRGAQDIVELDVARATATAAPAAAAGTSPYPKARGSVDHLPFAEESFDFLIYPSALAWRSDLPALIPEASRCLKDSGRVLLTTIHPFFEYLMNPRIGFKKHIDTLFGTLKKHSFFTEELKEGTIDDVVKSISLPPKLSEELKRYPGLPLVLTVKALRLARRRK
ncbi:MAG TPA: methyltransferase domain-containing protein [bacterium]|nr:methyltransferase domain-containing protein [bacterium]